MSSSVFYFPTTIEQLSDGTYSFTNLNLINDSTGEDTDFSYATIPSVVTSGTTYFNSIKSSNISITNLGINPTSIKIFCDRNLFDAVDTVRDTELYLLKNGTIATVNLMTYYTGSNRTNWRDVNDNYNRNYIEILLSDFSSIFLTSTTVSDLYNTNIGIQFKTSYVSGDSAHASNSPYKIHNLGMEFIYPTVTEPHFIYNGDTTSEVNITLDLNPAVTNSPTTFGIYHGNDINLLYRNPTAILSYTEYNLYTEPDSTSEEPLYVSVSTTTGAGIGIYPDNYLDTTSVNIVRGVSGLWGSDTTTSHTMNYITSNLVAGQTYRRGLVLLYKASDSSGVIFESGVYDVLYFNITVVDTTYSLIRPKFIYNGDTTSEVFVTLDKNPAVINQSTAFGVYHGDTIDTTAHGYVQFYNIGNIYTSPSGNDNTSDFYTTVDYGGVDVGIYITNYLSIDNTGWSALSTGIYESHTVTQHIMSYNVSNLTVGNTYRRGLALVYDETYFLIGEGSGGENPPGIYDMLYFNINVIDTSIVDYPRFIYNGDTTSVVEVTLDLNPEVTNPIITYGVFHGDADVISQYTAVGYRWGNNDIYGNIINTTSTGKFTPPDIDDPDYSDYTGVLVSPPMGIYQNNNILNTEYMSFNFSSRVGPYCCKNITEHELHFHTEGLIAGNTYTRGMGLENTRSYITPSQAKLYDTLYFNISVIDTTPEPELLTPKFIYNGDTSSEVFVTLDKNPLVTNSSTTVSLFHGYPSIESGLYGYGVYYTESNLNDPISNSFTPLTYFPDYGIYSNNYLLIDDYGTFLTDYSVIDFVVNYDISELVAGETYRRAIILNDNPINMINGTGNIYDILYFNIEVIDTSVGRRRTSGTYSNLIV